MKKLIFCSIIMILAFNVVADVRYKSNVEYGSQYINNQYIEQQAELQQQRALQEIADQERQNQLNYQQEQLNSRSYGTHVIGTDFGAILENN